MEEKYFAKILPFIDFLKIYLVFTVPGLHCFVRGSSSCEGWGSGTLVVVYGLLITVVSLVVEHRL